MQDFLIPFITICLAEFLDKSQLSLILLASRTKHHFQLFLGSILGFVVVDGVAIIFGSFITTLVPQNLLKILASVIFIFFGIKSLLDRGDEKSEVKNPKHAFLTGLSVILVSEWGDKTQLAAAVFATRYNMLLVFLAVMSALAILSASALFIGSRITTLVSKKTIHITAGILFILLGILFLMK